MKHLPFDFCDECGRKYLMEDLKGFLCFECRSPWSPSDPIDDDYDRITKSEDDR